MISRHRVKIGDLARSVFRAARDFPVDALHSQEKGLDGVFSHAATAALPVRPGDFPGATIAGAKPSLGRDKRRLEEAADNHVSASETEATFDERRLRHEGAPVDQRSILAQPQRYVTP